MSNQRIVVKVGTSTLTDGSPHLSKPRLIDLVRQLSWMRMQGLDVTLVSSGAVAAGRELIQFPQFPKHIPGKQVLSSIGQPRLMSIYMDLFQMYGQVASQILLTRADFVNRKSYLNARNTMEGLLAQNVIPIINENDTIATDEIRLGDNDTMSAFVAGLIGADTLLLLTDQDGLYDMNPETNPEAKLIHDVTGFTIPEEIWQAAGGSSNGLGTGGMVTKVRAADFARRMGTATMIANGKIPDILIKIASGEHFGTLFHPANSILDSRKRFLLTGYRSNEASITLDAGAEKAIQNGRSLLPAGICGVFGDFDRGDTIKMVNQAGDEIAIGMTNYSAKEIQQIAGAKVADIENILSYIFEDEIIQHDNMIFDTKDIV